MSDLFDVAVAEARAAFALAAASEDVTLVGEREERLVDMALTAGVVGALAALRDSDPGNG